MLSFQVRGLDGGRGLKSRIAGGRGVPAWWPGSKHEHLAPGAPWAGEELSGLCCPELFLDALCLRDGNLRKPLQCCLTGPTVTTGWGWALHPPGRTRPVLSPLMRWPDGCHGQAALWSRLLGGLGSPGHRGLEQLLTLAWRRRGGRPVGGGYAGPTGVCPARGALTS